MLCIFPPNITVSYGTRTKVSWVLVHCMGDPFVPPPCSSFGLSHSLYFNVFSSAFVLKFLGTNPSVDGVKLHTMSKIAKWMHRHTGNQSQRFVLLWPLQSEMYFIMIDYSQKNKKINCVKYLILPGNRPGNSLYIPLKMLVLSGG